MMRAFGKAKRMSLAPAANSSDPIEAACPMHSVETCGLMKFMVSKMDMPALTDPPGELI